MFNKTALQEVLSQTNKVQARLVVVSKNQTAEAISSIYETGHNIFGENRVSVLLEKYNQLPKDIEWHMIGHLQRKKVKMIAPFVTMIHSIDSLKLLVEVNKYALANDRIIDCLLQIHIAEEDSKYGLGYKELVELLENDSLSALKNIRLRGMMGMATFTDDQEKIRSEFENLASIFNQIKMDYFSDHDSFNELSMGMSGDYEIALDCGSTMVRVGSLIFNEV